MSTSVFRVRVSKKLKKEMGRLSDVVDWQTETRDFIKGRVREARIARQLESARRNKEKMKVTLDAAEMIREDREH